MTAKGTATSAEKDVTLVIEPAPPAPSGTGDGNGDGDGNGADGDGGNGAGGNGGGLAVTGQNVASILVVAGVAIALGGVLLLVARGRTRRFKAE